MERRRGIVQNPTMSRLNNSTGAKAGAGYRLLQSLDDWAIDGEASATKRRSARTSQETVLDECQYLKLLAKLTAVAIIDSVLRPLVEVGVPRRTVVQSNRRNSTEYIVWPESIR